MSLESHAWWGWKKKQRTIQPTISQLKTNSWSWNYINFPSSINNMYMYVYIITSKKYYYGCKRFAAAPAWMSFWLVVRTAASKSNADFPCKAPRLLQLRLKPFVARAKMPTQTTIALDGCHPASQYTIIQNWSFLNNYPFKYLSGITLSNSSLSGGSTSDGEKNKYRTKLE